MSLERVHEAKERFRDAVEAELQAETNYWTRYWQIRELLSPGEVLPRQLEDCRQKLIQTRVLREQARAIHERELNAYLDGND